MASPTPFTTDFDHFTEESFNKWHYPGVSWAVVHGADSWTKSYGLAQPNTRLAVEPTTLFYAASTTKAHFCAAWALYMESAANKSKPVEQQINWSTPLAEVIREAFVLADPVRTMQITLEDAVSHRTGLPRHELAYGYEGVDTPMGVTRNLRNLPLHNEIRTTYEYCNTPFMAATHALETLTGRPLAEYLHEKLWAPLGMTHTYAGFGEASKAVQEKGEIIAKGTIWSRLPSDPEEKGGHLIEEENMDFPEVSGAGYAISCSEDYTKWMRCFLDPARGPLTPEMIRELWSPRTSIPPDDSDIVPFDGLMAYGLGWYITTYKGHMCYLHTGGIIGAGSYILLCPDIEFGVSFFANLQDASIKLKGLVMELLDGALGVPVSKRIARKSVEEDCLKTYAKAAEKYANRRQALYPDAPPQQEIQPSLPIDAYAGTYTHPGYGSITITTSQGAYGHSYLECNVLDHTWDTFMTFEHVNAESWIVTRSTARSPLKSALKAESKIDAGGKVARFGIVMEPAMPDTMMWFARAD